MAKEDIKLIRGFCNPKCIYYDKKLDFSFTEENHATVINLCTCNGTARTFGCMSACPNGQPQLQPINEENA